MEISVKKTKLMTNNANDIQRELNVTGQKLSIVTTSEQLFLMMASNQRFSQGLHKPLQLLQSCSPFGEITTYLLDQW